MIIMRDNARIASGLSPRLAAAAAMLGPAHTVWDVGCDHGFLSAHLIKSGAAQNVIATDLSPVSVAKAARFAERRGLSDRMRFAVTDGLSGFEPSGGYKLAVCGMGGELIASILGAKCIVVHPKQHLPYRRNAETLKKINFDFYKSLIPYCEQFGIKVAVENMWQMNPVGRKTIVNSTCARVEEFCEYVDMLDSDFIVA